MFPYRPTLAMLFRKYQVETVLFYVLKTLKQDKEYLALCITQ